MVLKMVRKKVNLNEEIDMKKSIEAAKEMERIRKFGVFSGGKKAEDIIRKFRDKRK